MPNQAEYNPATGIPEANAAKLDATLTQIAGIEKYRWSDHAPAEPVSVNGQPIGDRLLRGKNGPSQTAQAALQLMSDVQGYSVTSNDIPNVAKITAGRNLAATDENSSNVIVSDLLHGGAPHLNPGDTLDLINPRTNFRRR